MELGIGIFLITATFYFYVGLQRSLQLARKAKIKLWGEEALATILFIEKDESRPAEKRYKIQIQVEPVLGRNFVTDLTDLPKSIIHSVKVGDKMHVKFLPKNSRKVIFIRLLSID
ncbi:hypothetical protein [Dyadobacter psychrophilus]|uniref:DUF3592 domain-containing protein n=1 Tax=Dyadobacter psychrophilus TaxID=651661 RepID=A0A1T5HCC8_9BACT|nr:hypothetical protein [Dyadobacter psychrophilus]SKC18230.1 hypothetical protein SAMN05660293_05288 [Dyadobacter psychrophilus]